MIRIVREAMAEWEIRLPFVLRDLRSFFLFLVTLKMLHKDSKFLVHHLMSIVSFGGK